MGLAVPYPGHGIITAETRINNSDLVSSKELAVLLFNPFYNSWLSFLLLLLNNSFTGQVMVSALTARYMIKGAIKNMVWVCKFQSIADRTGIHTTKIPLIPASL